MKRSVLLAAIAVSLVFVSPLVLHNARSADEEAEKPIREMLDAYVAAFNKCDSAAVGECWRTDGVYIDRATGDRAKGREAIVASLAETFGRPEKLMLRLAVNEIRFLTPEVAQLEGVAAVSAPDIDPFLTNVSAIAIKSGDKEPTWQLSSVEEIPPAVPESAAEALMPLAWMEGTWTDQSDDESDATPVRSTIRWSRNYSFLIRSFVGTNNADEEAEGTQVIGWDPVAKHIRSWSFFSDGAFSEAVWTKVGEDWSIKSTQTLADGRVATGTFLIERVDTDTMKVQLVAHEVDGESLPAKPAIRVVRQPDEEEQASSEEASSDDKASKDKSSEDAPPAPKKDPAPAKKKSN